MNKIILIGRLTKDPEVRYSQGENPIPIARYSIAVDKRQKRDDGITADFFNLVAFDRNATFAEKYLRKGTKIAVTGHVQTGRYEKNGVSMPFFETVVEEQEFAESKSASQSSGNNQNQNHAAEGDFMLLPDDLDDLPFD
jgi:single-strand DNA-binding protein